MSHLLNNPDNLNTVPVFLYDSMFFVKKVVKYKRKIYKITKAAICSYSEKKFYVFCKISCEIYEENLEDYKSSHLLLL